METNRAVNATVRRHILEQGMAPCFMNGDKKILPEEHFVIADTAQEVKAKIDRAIVKMHAIGCTTINYTLRSEEPLEKNWGDSLRMFQHTVSVCGWNETGVYDHSALIRTPHLFE